MEQQPLVPHEKSTETIRDAIKAVKVIDELRTAPQELEDEGDSETLTPRQREARLRNKIARNAFRQGDSNPLIGNYAREHELDEIEAIMSDGSDLTGNHTGGHRARVSIDTDGEW